MNTMPAAVAAVFDALPAAPARRLKEMRDIVLAAGAASNVGEVEETLKWGQPAYLPKKKRTGTTVRLGWSPSDPEHCAMYVHCQTALVDAFRNRFPDEFAYVDNRAVMVPLNSEFSKDALHHMATMALTYHRNKPR